MEFPCGGSGVRRRLWTARTNVAKADAAFLSSKRNWPTTHRSRRAKVSPLLFVLSAGTGTIILQNSNGYGLWITGPSGKSCICPWFRHNLKQHRLGSDHVLNLHWVVRVRPMGKRILHRPLFV